MYVIFKNGGKQYKATKNQILNLEKINKQVNTEIEFKNIIAIIKDGNINIQQNIQKNFIILGKILYHKRNKKIRIIKFKRRKHSKKCYCHRQWFTKVKIIDILEVKKDIYGS